MLSYRIPFPMKNALHIWFLLYEKYLNKNFIFVWNIMILCHLLRGLCNIERACIKAGGITSSCLFSSGSVILENIGLC